MNPTLQTEIKDLENALESMDTAGTEAENAAAQKKILYQIAKKYDEAQEWDTAKEYLQKAFGLLKSYNPEEGEEAELLFNLAGIALDQQKNQEAAHYYQQILDLPESDYWGKAYYGVGFYQMSSQQWKEALTNFEKSLDWNQGRGLSEDLGKIHHLLAVTYLQEGQNALALEHFEESVAQHTAQQNYQGLERTFFNLRQFIKEAMRPQNQLTFYQNHIQQSEEEGQEALAGFWYYYRALWYEEEQQTQAALQDFEKALELHQKQQVDNLKGLLYYHIGALYEEVGRHGPAILYHAEALEDMMAKKQYAKVGLIAYFLQSSLQDVKDENLLQKIQDLQKQVEALGLGLDQDDADTEENAQTPDWSSNDSIAEHLAAVVEMNQKALEERQKELKNNLPETWSDFLEASQEMDERYAQAHKNAWFGRKKKEQKHQEFRASLLSDLAQLLQDTSLSAEQLEEIKKFKEGLTV